MEGKEIVKIKSMNYYVDRFFKKLKEPHSIVNPLASLCGGWYLETFKQVVNKLSKNKSSPLPLVFPSIDSMESISKKKPLLKGVFQVFDSRGFSKIDASEFYTSCLALSKGSYQTYLKTIVDIFGFQTPAKITRNQFFFFLDSYFRAIPKILITKDTNNKEVNVRLDFKDINKFLDLIFEERTELQRNEIYEALMKAPQLNELMKYVQKRGTASAGSSRAVDIERMKIEGQAMECLSAVVMEVARRLQK